MSTNYNALIASIEEDLKTLTDLTEPARYNDPRLWLVTKLYLANVRWTPELVESAIEAMNHSGHWKVFIIEKLAAFYNEWQLAELDLGRLRFIILSLLASAAKKKVTTLPASLRYRGLKPENELIKLSLFSSFFTRFALELCAETTPNKYKAFESIFESKLDGCAISYTSRTANMGYLCQYAICCGINSFDEMTPQSFTDFWRQAQAINESSSPPWKQVCGFLESRGYLPNGWVDETSILIMNGNKLPLSNANVSERLINGIRYESLRLVAKLVGSRPVHKLVAVYAPLKREAAVEIGGITLPTKTSKYKPEDLVGDDLWKRTQLSFVDLSSIERGTAKTRKGALSILNAYIFGYLPEFFKRNPDCLFEYPNTPSKFISSIFVKCDYVLDGIYKEQAEATGKRVVYPVPLPEFMTAMSRSETQREGSKLRDDLALIRRYFDDIITKYSAIDGTNLPSNPIPKFQHVGRKESSKTKKVLLDMRYWVLFRMFLKEVSKAMVVSVAKRLLLPINSKHIDPRLVEELAKFVTYLCEMKGFEHLKSAKLSETMFEPLCIHVDTAINMGDISANIGTVYFPKWEKLWMQTRKIGNDGATVNLLSYQRILILLVAAYAGQRASNAANLCADTFDANYHPTGTDDLTGSLVPLRIRTDKIHIGGIDSAIAEDCMLILQLSKRIRDCFSEEAFCKPNNYQGNEQSSQGAFRALLQTSALNTSFHPRMPAYLSMFEDWLKRHGYDFESQIFYAPLAASADQVDFSRRTGRELDVPSYFIRYLNFDNLVPFTPIVPKSLITPHSLRAQLVTFISMATGDRDAVRLFTAQTDGVIDFYTKPNLEHAKVLGKVSSLSVVSVTDTQLSRADVFKALGDADSIGDLPFFASGAEGLQTLREVGGNELALNYTHICPHNNRCPSTIINTIGRMNCYACPLACVSEHHAIAISATIRVAVEDMREIKCLIDCSSSESEKQMLSSRLNDVVVMASGWLVRLRFIQSNKGRFVVNGVDGLASFEAVKESAVLNQLMARLKEVDGVPSLQSSNIKQHAKVIAGRLMVKISKQQLPDFLSHDRDSALRDPVKYVVQNLLLLADLQQTTPEKLMHEALRDLDNPLLLEDIIG